MNDDGSALGGTLAVMGPFWVLFAVLAALGSCVGPIQAPPPPPAVPQPPAPRAAGVPVFVLQAGHTDAVHSVAFSPDGRTVATGSGDRTIALWDAASGALRATLRGHTAAVTSLAFSPDGQTIVSGGDTVRRWDASRGVPKAASATDEDPWTDAEHGVISLAFRADGGTVVASQGEDDTVRLRDGSGALLATLAGHEGFIKCAAFSPDGRVITGSEDRSVRLWDVETGALQATLRGHTDVVEAVAVSTDGLTIASGSRDGTVRLWDAASATLRATLVGHSDWVWALALSPDGQTVASASQDGTVRLWDAATGSQTALSGDAQQVTSLAFSPDGRSVATGSYAKARLWDIATGRPLAHLEGFTDVVAAVAFSPDGQTIASAGRSVRLWDASTGALRATLAGHERHVAAVAFSPDGRRLAAGSLGGVVRVWNVSSEALAASLHGHQGIVQSVAFSPDGTRIVSGGNDGTVRLWGVTSGTLEATIDGHSAKVASVAFSPDGTTVVSGSWDTTVRLWDASNGAARTTLQGHRNSRVTGVAFRPDGTQVAAVGTDGHVRVWDAASGVLRATIDQRAAGGSHAMVAYSVDGRTIASTNHGETVRVWDASSGELRAELQGHSGTVRGVAFHPDGRTLASGGADGLVLHRLVDGARIHLGAFPTEGRTPSLVYTANGLFTGDRAARERVLFRVGPDIRTADMLTADQLFESFHRPTLVEDFVAGRPLEPLPEVRDGIGLPPAVRFVAAPGGVATGERVRVRVLATDRGGGVSAIRVRVNNARQGGERGVRLTQGPSAKAAIQYEQEVELTLLPGDNVITAEADNVLGRITGSKARLEVTLPAVALERPDLHVLVLTLEHYVDPDLRLDYPEDDGRALIAAFRRQQGRLFEQVYIEHLRDQLATREGVLAALDRIATRARGSDVFVMFASGHGGMVRCRGDEQGMYRLLTYRASLANERRLCAEALSTAVLTTKLGAIKANKKLLILDTCQAGSAATGATLLAMRARGGEHVHAIARLARSEGLAILSASTAEESAFEVPQLGHGLFTYTLLRGLGGEAAFGEQHVSVSALKLYADNELPRLAQQHLGRRQMPISAVEGDFPLFALEPGDKPLVAPPKRTQPEPHQGLPAATDAIVRAHIDARRDAILACLDASALAIRATIVSSGEVRFEPRYQSVAPADAKCVQAALGQLRVSAGGCTGTVVHAIQRADVP